jgi:hypothetical protein
MLPTPLPTQLPTPLPTELPTISPTPLPTPAPSEVPTSVPTSAPTPVLRGYKDCVCVSALTVKKLKVHCPEVAAHFAADSCLYNMTSADLATIAVDCDALQTDFFTSL